MRTDYRLGSVILALVEGAAAMIAQTLASAGPVSIPAQEVPAAPLTTQVCRMIPGDCAVDEKNPN
jgi:hypothetical protein